uniref:Piezo type mechanosensitive ion channel component 1 (Er blood group) n=1 Tax=Anolis carolinensis TaxID=28377 RepID=H9GC02_ANOCA
MDEGFSRVSVLGFAGHTGRLLRALLATSILFLLAHLAFQICLYTVPGLDQRLGYNCSTWETLAQHIGVTRLDLNDIPNSVRLVAPDVGILLVSAICLGVCGRLVPSRKPGPGSSRRPVSQQLQEQEEAAVDEEPAKGRDLSDVAAEVSRRRHAPLSARLRVKAHWLLMAMGKILAVALLALVGITLPSAFSAVYYLLFVGLCTCALCVMVDVFAGGHLVCLYGYQTPFMQTLLPPAGLWARLFGLKAIVLHAGCSKPNALLLDLSLPWPVYVNPGILLLLYYVLATLVKLRRSHSYDRVSFNMMDITGYGLVLWISMGLVYARMTPPSDPFNCTVHTLEEPEPLGKDIMLGCEKLHLLHSLGHIVMDQSYVCALIAMMVWSITYHSWLTFVLLLWACLIWIVRNRHQLAMLCSPFILLYGVALCSLQYVWGMDLEAELPTRVGFMPLQQLGLRTPLRPCLDLGAKLLYTLTFWLLVRQFVKEKLLKKKQPVAPLKEVTVTDSGAIPKRDVLKTLGAYVTGFFAKFWILVCAGMFIVVTFAGRLVVYKIVYMFLFLLSLTLFQVYYSLWRKLLKAFWWLVVAYTMLVLIAVYTFQFEDFPMYWRNFTGLTDEQLGDLGLEQFSVSELFSSIFIPGFFLLACICSCIISTASSCVSRIWSTSLARDTVHWGMSCVIIFFSVCATTEAVPSKWGLVLERLMVLGGTFLDVLGRLRVFVLRLLELHVLKLVVLYVIWVSLQEVSTMNLLLVVLWAIAVPYSSFSHMASCLSTVWVCIIIVCKMLYQLNVVNPQDYYINCTKVERGTSVHLPMYLSVHLSVRLPIYPSIHLPIYICIYLSIRILLPHCLGDSGSCNPKDNLFSSPPSFLAQICFLMTVNVIGQRMNFMVIFHGCWLVVILTRRRRQAIARLWPKYCLFLAFFLIFQYLLCVGIPPGLCEDYPWRWSHAIPINSVLIKWMYLPDFFMKPNSINLMSDFLLLLGASQQWKVFVNEQTDEWKRLAGDNREHLEGLRGEPNPVPNFVNCRSYLDMLKLCVFRYLFWFVLVIVFVAGANRISVFGLGYLTACFYLLLFGTALLRKPLRARLLLWDCLIIYNVTVIIVKNLLALLSCVFVQQMQNNFCWVIQLFSLACTVKGYYDREYLQNYYDCALPVEEAGIIWDSICFFFLLLQRRVFLSYYFLHVAADLQASALQFPNFLLFGGDEFAVLHSGDYFLFETDSEEDEESCLPGEILTNGTVLHSSPSSVPGKSNVLQRVLNTLRFLWVLCQATMDGLTQWLRALTKEHEELSTVLGLERYVLTQQLDQVSHPFSPLMMLPFLLSSCDAPSSSLIFAGEAVEVLSTDTTGYETRSNSNERSPEFESQDGMMLLLPSSSQELLADSVTRPRTASELLQSRHVSFKELEESERFYQSRNRLVRLLLAGYHFVAGHSDLLCYFIIILNNMVTASVVSVVLPILVFLWAMLSIPRPSKRFWMTAIVYTEVMVVVKYLFQFGFFPWNSYSILVRNDAKAFFPPRILGVEKTDNYIKYDLIQLMALFFHRSLLLSYGLWDHEEDVLAKPLPEAGEPPVSVPSGEGPGAETDAQVPPGKTEAAAVPEAEMSKGIRSRFRKKKKEKKEKEKKEKEKSRSEHAALSYSLFPPSFRAGCVFQPLRQFFRDILHSKYRAATDVYALMFLADVVDFIIIIFGFWAFGKHSAAADIASSLSEDQVPQAFLVMLLIQFSTMVIDRALYLRKSVLGKLAFQVFLVFGIHVWMFFILPAKYPQPKGQKKKKIVKYGMGGLIILFLICIIWFPLLFMSLVRSVVGVVNHPIDVTITLKLGGYEPLFTMSAQQQSIVPFTPKDYEALTDKFVRQPLAMQFITLYGYEDIVTARIEGNSGSLWSISPPSREQLRQELQNGSSDITLRFTWNFQRDLGKGGTVEYTSEKHTMDLNQSSAVRRSLAGLLEGTHNASVVPHLFPPYIRAPNGPEANPVEQLLPDEEDSYLDVAVQLRRQRIGAGNASASFVEWWVIQLADCQHDCDILPMLIFNDKVSPPSLGFLAGYGIMGLYVSIVLVIGKFVRGFFSEISHSIMFEELPCVDRILKLCHDIFLVRETGELELEEELYAKLIFLYRSPETMIKWTREKE